MRIHHLTNRYDPSTTSHYIIAEWARAQQGTCPDIYCLVIPAGRRRRRWASRGPLAYNAFSMSHSARGLWWWRWSRTKGLGLVRSILGKLQEPKMIVGSDDARRNESFPFRIFPKRNLCTTGRAQRGRWVQVASSFRVRPGSSRRLSRHREHAKSGLEPMGPMPVLRSCCL